MIVFSKNTKILYWLSILSICKLKTINVVIKTNENKNLKLTKRQKIL